MPEKLMVNCWAAAGIVIVQLRLAVCPATSLTVTVNGWFAPGCVAWPVSTPVVGTMANMAGAPVAVHANGPVPVAVKVTLTLFTNAATAGSWQVVPDRVPGHIIAGGAGLLTVIVNCGETAVRGGLWESCTCTTNMKVPAACGVPEILPAVDKVMCTGN